MKTFRIYRVEAERKKFLETLVLAEDECDAEFLVNKAIRNSELEFENSFGDRHEITSVLPIDITNSVIKEIKTYGILNGDEVTCDENIIEEVSNSNRSRQKEEYLKKYHLELNLGI